VDQRANRGKPLVSATIYVEGGGDNKDTLVRCRQGFAEYCAKLAPTNRRPKIVACGGRQQAFDRFRTELRISPATEVCVLLVDSEGPVSTNVAPAAYLQVRDGWIFPDSNNFRSFLMVQAMEAWFLADRETLAAFYGPDFRANALPGDSRQIEPILKEDLEPSLVNATRAIKSKGPYHKTRHAFALLTLIDPAKVGRASPRAADFNEFLRSL
jgi:hypothetical protein